MGIKARNLPTKLYKLKVWNILPFIVWPLLFLVAFFVMYNHMVRLYLNEIEYEGTNTAGRISDNFLDYLNNVDDALKSSVNTVEYLMENDADSEEILKYITYESEKLGIVSATGSRGIFGLFEGEFLHGLGWDPGDSYDPKERMWYQGALKKNGEYTFVGPYYNKRTDEYVVTAVKLLDDNESVICFAIDYDTFKKMTTGESKAGETMMILAMNEDGYVLANSASEEIGEDYASSQDPLKRAIYKAIQENPDKNTFSIGSGNGVKDSYVISKRHVLYDLYVVTVTNSNEVLVGLNGAAMVFGVILIAGMIIILILNIKTLIKDLAAKERAENLESISNIYVTMHRIDMIHDTFEQITCMDYRALQILGDKEIGASEMMKLVMPQMVDERSKELITSFVDLSTLNERMKFNETITAEFLTYEHIWHRARFIVIDRDSNKNLKNVLFATEIIDDEKRARDRLKYLAETDQLTGINNRGCGENKISDLLTKNVGGMFILFDVDKFKFVNDNFGHDVGDEVLIAVAETMQHCFRERDVIMRLGGDEFAAYMPSVFSEEDGDQILDRFIEAIHDMKVPKLGGHQINISIGAAFFYPTDTFSFEELYKRADSCTYSSKKVEGSAVTFYKRKDHE